MDSQWALFVVTAVLVVITLWYASATWLMAKRMKEQTDAIIAPRVSVRVERRDHRVLLIVENSGSSPVRDLHLRVDRAVPTCDHDWMLPLGDHRMFHEPCVRLGGDSRHEIVIGDESFILKDQADYAPAFNVTASYSWNGRPVRDEFRLEVWNLWTDAQRMAALRSLRESGSL